MDDLDARGLLDAGADLEDVVVHRGAPESLVELGDDEEDAGAFELGVGDAAGAEELGAPHLEPRRERGVMDDAHGVAFAVADAELDGAFGLEGRGGRGVRHGSYPTNVMADEVQTILEMWDFADPAGSEARFRAAMAGAAGSRRLELQTQVARALGLQRRFEEAHALLDEIEGDGGVVGVRLALEHGRLLNSSGRGEEARPHFEAAYAIARKAGLDGLAVDAAHMVAIVECGEACDAWHARALELAESSDDPDARRWRASLLNNIGWTLHEHGEFEAALDCFERALSARLEQGQARETAIARWCVARCLRSLGRVDEALAMQREIYDESTDEGYGAEEIGECLLALGRGDEAKGFFGVAHRKLDGVIDGERLERLGRLAR